VSDYRLKRGPVLVLLVLVGLVGVFLIGRSSTRPVLDVLAPVTVPDAYAGTAYGFDGLVCLRASSVGAEVSAVEGGTGSGVRTQLLRRAQGSPPTVAFPVEGEPGGPVVGLRVAAGDSSCLRVVVAADRQGEQRARQVQVHVAYGPLGLLRSTLEVTPPVVLQVTGTGRDPRADL
jgi:hypothetical protein